MLFKHLIEYIYQVRESKKNELLTWLNNFSGLITSTLIVNMHLLLKQILYSPDFLQSL